MNKLSILQQLEYTNAAKDLISSAKQKLRAKMIDSNVDSDTAKMCNTFLSQDPIVIEYLLSQLAYTIIKISCKNKKSQKIKALLNACEKEANDLQPLIKDFCLPTISSKYLNELLSMSA